MISHFARLASAMTIGLAASGIQAQAFPAKPITLIVPFSPGASADGISRIVGNEPGANRGGAPASWTAATESAESPLSVRALP